MFSSKFVLEMSGSAPLATLDISFDSGWRRKLITFLTTFLKRKQVFGSKYVTFSLFEASKGGK
jgi:hypothetical protein